MVEISSAYETFEREPLRKPFGFKGGYVTELWQTIVRLETRGHRSIGLGTQSVLWSDPAVFASRSEAGGNALMFAVLAFAARHCGNSSFESPLDLLDEAFPANYAYARRITNRPNLRTTFVLNALVAVDNAAWLLYARENGVDTFDEMVPKPYRAALSHRHRAVASIPAIGFGSTIDDIRAVAEDGYFVIKVKLGHPGSQSEMLAQDKRRMEEVHGIFGPRETTHTASGRILYYLDINGRYDGIGRLETLIDYLANLGALDQVLLIEEPFSENMEADVSSLGVRIAADESAHTDADARRLIDMGYGAIALKPVAKTVSMTLKIAAEAHRRGIPCFCADLTVNPVLVEWNKCFAARLAPLPGLDCGLLETNGHQNYRHWQRMMGYHPCPEASWTTATAGAFRLGDDFYTRSGGIFEPPKHYAELVQPKS